MQRTTSVLMTLGLGLVVGCSAGVSVNSDYAPGTDFSKFSTYDWLPDAQTDGSGKADPIADERIRMAIDSNLVSKGLRKVSGGGDLMVGYQITTKDDVSYQTVGSAWGAGGWRWGGGMAMGSSTTTAYHTTVGTLVISIFESQGKTMVWHGSGQSDLQKTTDPQERQEKIDDAVDKILGTFPPPTSGSR